MAEKKTAKKGTKTPAKRTGTSNHTFTAEERAAMRERAQELKAVQRNREQGERALLAKVAEMPEPDRAMAERLHAIVTESAPALWPKTWYGMPAYAKDDKIVCFFQSAEKFKSRYATLGFNDEGEPRRGRHVADLLRAEEAVGRGRAKDQRARQESGELRPPTRRDASGVTRRGAGGVLASSPTKRRFSR